MGFMTDAAGGTAEDLLLLFRKVDEPVRRALGWQLLDAGMGDRSWRLGSDLDLWELSDVAAGEEEEPVAVAATCSLGDGRRVRLLALVVDAGYRRRGIGRRMLEELVDALRSRGVLVLVAAVPVDLAPAILTIQRAGLRPSHVERAATTVGASDMVRFDVEL